MIGKFGKIALVSGGSSSEREISLRTGDAFERALEQLDVQFRRFDLGSQALPELLAWNPDCVLNAMHGRDGEGGPLQGALEFARIPYTGSGLLASALAMDKVASKRIFDSAEVLTPAWGVLEPGSEGLPDGLEFPVVVKPSQDGSSVGISVVGDASELDAAVRKAHSGISRALVEACIDGEELSIGFHDGHCLGSVQIRPAAGFYDFDAKYERGDTSYELPPLMDPEVVANAEAEAACAWRALGCRGVGRVDVMVDADGAPWVLEANTVPGMTETSLVPKMAEYRGISFSTLVSRMIESATLDGDEG